VTPAKGVFSLELPRDSMYVVLTGGGA
jgi:hypothetical protein